MQGLAIAGCLPYFWHMSKAFTMKTFFLSFLAVVVLACSAGAQQAAGSDAALSFPELEFNFSKIPQGKPVYHQFQVVNNSKEPVKIENVHASCGCTTPEWSRDAIAPGATAIIKVGYNAAAEGAFDKTITVAYGNNTQVLRIKGEVWKTPVTSAPPNASVQFLKKQLQQ